MNNLGFKLLSKEDNAANRMSLEERDLSVTGNGDLRLSSCCRYGRLEFMEWEKDGRDMWVDRGMPYPEWVIHKYKDVKRDNN